MIILNCRSRGDQARLLERAHRKDDENRGDSTTLPNFWVVQKLVRRSRSGISMLRCLVENGSGDRVDDNHQILVGKDNFRRSWARGTSGVWVDETPWYARLFDFASRRHFRWPSFGGDEFIGGQIWVSELVVVSCLGARS